MTLLAHQKITRVLPGKPFGDGIDGVYSSATIPTMVAHSIAGTSGANTLSIGANSLSNGDILMLHQTRGTGAGQWEIVMILSGGGTGTLTLTTNLQYTYTDSGASQAQAVKIPRYTDVTVQAGTWTVPAWDGNVGGILVFASNGITTVTGAITAVGKGFRSAGVGYQGESPIAAGTANSASPNGPGGGGNNSGTPSGGAGASYDGNGGTGGVNDASAQPTNPTQGTFDATKIFLGSAGGAGQEQLGGLGGGSVLVIAKTLVVTGSINVGGQNVSGTVNRPGGGSAGGLCLLECSTATLGSSLITSPAGQPGGRANAWNCVPTAGTVGRIHLDYSVSYTGSTTPTLDSSIDADLVESTGLPFPPIFFRGGFALG